MTGCAGFVGSHLAHQLLREGANVLGLVRGTAPAPDSYLAREGLAAEIELVPGDVLDESRLRRLLARRPPDCVFHLAARSTEPRAAHERRYFENVRGARNLLRAAHESAPEAVVVLASSIAVYGARTSMPRTEESPPAPDSAYAASKAAMERIADRCHAVHGMRTGVARMSNVYGGGDSNFSRLVPGTVRALLRGAVPEIRDGGGAARDYLYVGDAVAALLRLAFGVDRRGLDGQTINVASGRSTRTAAVVRSLAALCGRPDLIPALDTAGGGDRGPSVTRADRLLDWRAEVDLETGLAHTVAWYADAGVGRVGD